MSKYTLKLIDEKGVEIINETILAKDLNYTLKNHLLPITTASSFTRSYVRTGTDIKIGAYVRNQDFQKDLDEVLKGLNNETK